MVERSRPSALQIYVSQPSHAVRVGADVLFEIHAGLALQRESRRPRRRIEIRVRDPDDTPNGLGIRQRVALLDFQLLAMRQSRIVEPRLVVETDGVDHERRTLESSNGVAEIVRIRIL